MSILVFDIETIPDVEGGRRLYGLDGLEDKDVANILYHKRRQETGKEFLRLHLQRIVAISVVYNDQDDIKVCSLGEASSSEQELLQAFFGLIEQYTPLLVSWNGSAFDLPVIHYRALVNSVAAPRYWETGDEDQEFRCNNYLSRYHTRHTDLMDVLSGYQAQANVPLDEIASLLGFPGKLAGTVTDTWEEYLAGNLQGIRHHSQAHVLNTYLVHLRYELIRGVLSEGNYRYSCQQLRDYLGQENQAHFTEFLKRWPG